MKVIIHQANNFLTKDKTLDDFILETITEMCKTQAGQAFVWLSYDNIQPVTYFESVRHIMLRPPVLGGPWKQFWLNRQLASVIKSQNPSCIIWLDGPRIKTHASQCVLVTQVNNKTDKKLLKDATIITISDYLKQLLEKKGLNPETIHVIRPKPLRLFAPADWDTRENTKNNYASGTEYFFFFTNQTATGQVLLVLKAFSIFKKWQKSAARLLIYTQDDLNAAQWKKTLPSYKFRDDIIVQHAENNDERARLTASAMCALYFPERDDTGLHLMECLQAQVPVITHNVGAITEVAEEAALYCSADDIQDVADKMKRIYRDEKLRTQLAAKIAEISAKHDDNNAPEQLWSIIEKTTKQTAIEAEKA